MIPEARALRDALTRIYRPWLLHLFESRGWEPGPSLVTAVDDGEQWLADRLDHLLAQPFDRQRRGPLEVFQEAMRFPTAALIDLGVDGVERDPTAIQAIPGDVFDLAPASSAMLGDTVWQAHLTWGAAKANALRQA
jgi:hypothetical protein